MALNPFIDILFSFFTLLKGSVILTIPIFLSVLILSIPFKFLQKKYNLSWLKSASLLVYVVSFILLIFLFFSNFQTALIETPLQLYPPEIAQETGLTPVFYIFSIIRLVLIALMYTLLTMPFVLLGSMFLSFFKDKLKKWPSAISLFLAVLTVSTIISIILLFTASFLLQGLFYLTFFGFT